LKPKLPPWEGANEAQGAYRGARGAPPEGGHFRRYVNQGMYFLIYLRFTEKYVWWNRFKKCKIFSKKVQKLL